MKTNWTAIIMTALTVFVGLTCALLALTLGKGDSTASGLLFGVAGTALGSFLKQPHKAGEDGAPPLPPAAAIMLLLALSVASLALPAVARADANDPATGGCVAKNDDGTCKYASGVDACVAFRVSPDQPNQYIGALMFHVLKFGSVGIGALGQQGANGMYYQGLLFFAPRLPVQ